MMILHNLSFETDCCDCCKVDPSAKIPQPIMDSINNGLGQKIRSHYIKRTNKRNDIGYVQKICTSCDSCGFSSCSPIAIKWQRSIICKIQIMDLYLF
jgi:hypothetical protein